MRPSNGQREHQQASPLKLLFILLLHYRLPLWSALSIPLAETLTPVCCCSEVSRTRQMGTLNSLACNAECCLYPTGWDETSLTKSGCLIFTINFRKTESSEKMFYWLLERKRVVMNEEMSFIILLMRWRVQTPGSLSLFHRARAVNVQVLFTEKKRSAAPARLTPLAVLHGGFQGQEAEVETPGPSGSLVWRWHIHSRVYEAGSNIPNSDHSWLK